jgi:hypothetical protein
MTEKNLNKSLQVKFISFIFELSKQTNMKKVKVIPFVLSILGLITIGISVGLALQSKGYIKNEEFAFFFGTGLLFLFILFLSLNANKNDFTW